jgi:hypothetical protein
MTIIKEILAKEELKKIADLLGLSQAALQQHTLQQAKEALQAKVQNLEEGEKLKDANNLLDKFKELTEEDWKDSLNDSNSQAANTTPAKSPSPQFLFACFGPEEKELVNKIKQAYSNITGKNPGEKTYQTADELKADKNIPELIKNKLLREPSFPCKLILLKFESKQQHDEFMNAIPEAAKSKFNPIATPSPTAPMQNETGEEQQQSNYPSPFNMRLTPMATP